MSGVPPYVVVPATAAGARPSSVLASSALKQRLPQAVEHAFQPRLTLLQASHPFSQPLIKPINASFQMDKAGIYLGKPAVNLTKACLLSFFQLSEAAIYLLEALIGALRHGYQDGQDCYSHA